MARRFTAASSEKITLGLGATNFAFGPGTVAAVIRLSAVSAQVVFSAGSVGTACFQLSVTAGGVTQLTCNAASTSGGQALTANKWYLIAATKATGTATPVMHVRDYDNNSWQHVNAGGTLANSSAGTTRAALGVDSTGLLNFFDGDITAVACWNVVLTSLQVESLSADYGSHNWSGYAVPRGLWIPFRDPAFPVYDITGGGATEASRVGTSATADEFPFMNPQVRMPSQGRNYEM